MSDDLVKWLRDLGDHAAFESHMHHTAADRIQELEAKLAACEKYRDAYAECDRIGTQSVRELEAKLAKAVDVIEWVLIALDDHHKHGYNMQGDWEPDARTTLAELTGGKDE